jgi:hypothetical protein
VLVCGGCGLGAGDSGAAASFPPWPTATADVSAAHPSAAPNTPPSATTPTPTPITTSAKPSASGPDVAVVAYFAAINAHEYEEAWELGGKNVSPSYRTFVDGFAKTVNDDVTIDSVSGDTVTVTLIATQSDGSSVTYKGTYTVSGEVIVGSHMWLAG